jgi:hypothetical protein
MDSRVTNFQRSSGHRPPLPTFSFERRRFAFVQRYSVYGAWVVLVVGNQLGLTVQGVREIVGLKGHGSVQCVSSWEFDLGGQTW